MKALLVDDHPLILFGLRAVMEGFGGDVIVACVETARAARDLLASDPCYDLVLLDLQLGECSGFDLLIELRATYPDISVVVLSSSDSNEDVTRAIYLGAMGFVPKRASNQVLFGALNMVMSGGIYVPPMALRSQAAPPPARPHDLFRSGNGALPSSAAESSSTRSSAAALGLTPRQTDVLELLLQGQSNKLIARALNLSVETIKDHVAAVLRTLNVSSRTQAVLAVSQRSAPTPPLPWRDAHRSDTRAGA
jgi:DNA-binding NarL/FixJ family response regulator